MIHIAIHRLWRPMRGLARVFALAMFAVLLTGCGAAMNAIALTPGPGGASAQTVTPNLSGFLEATRTPANDVMETPQPEATGTIAARTTPTRKPKATATFAPATSVPVSLDGYQTIAAGDLPPEALHTLALIDQGGPFPYSHDGIVFQNREGTLPRKSASYYHEYTVVTPGAGDRGARRIITGSNGEFYYTDDHYATFERVIR